MVAFGASGEAPGILVQFSCDGVAAPPLMLYWDGDLNGLVP